VYNKYIKVIILLLEKGFSNMVRLNLLIFKKLTFLLVLIILLIFMAEESYANKLIVDGIRPSFELLDRDSGLSNLSVSSIVQDRYGFLWFGTQGGLNSYNGREMTIYRNDPFKDNDLQHNLIQTLYYDKEKHELWIGTYQGLSRLYIDKKEFKNYTVEEDGLSNSVVIAITIDSHDNVWIGTMNGLDKLNPATGTIKHYDISGEVVRSLKIDSKGRLLIGSYKGLLYYDDKTDSLVNLNLDLPSPYVMVIEEYEEGELTLGLWDGGIVKYNMEDESITTISFEDNRIYTILKTNDGTEWVGSWGGGLYAITNEGTRYYFSGEGSNRSLPHPIVYSLFQDESDILWIGTNGGGLIKVNPLKRNFVKLSHDPKNSNNSLSAGKINSILRDSKGDLWIAVYNMGLNRYIPSEDKIIKYRNNPENTNSIHNDSITDILEIENNKIMFATADGLGCYDSNIDEFYKLNILNDEHIVYAIEEIENDELLIGTYNNGLFRYNKNTKEIIQYKYKNQKNNLSDNLVYDILYDSQERIWVATNNGLNLLEKDADKFKIYRKVKGDINQLASNTTRVLFEDSQKRIWIGLVGGGIALYNDENDSFKNYLESDGLSSNTVIGILEDNTGRIWVSTHNGISIINPATDDIFVLTPNDGIGGWEFNSGHFKDNDNTLMFGGIHGITVIPADYTNKDYYIPRVYITSVNIFQTPIDSNRTFFNNDKYTFDYNERFLGFEFTALDYDAPEKVIFSYKLKGFDKEWVNAGTRNYVSYSNLPAGDYEFTVLARSSRGVISEPVSVYISINNPWYNTKLAYLFYIIVSVFIIIVFLKIRDWYLLNKKNSELASINNKLKKANQKLETLSSRDQLTGLYNRRYFNNMLNELINLAKRSETYLSLIIIDVDKFKSINDRFGHLVGDYYLSDLSEALSQELTRSTDFVARYGGDEFVIVLYDTDVNGAMLVARKIKTTVSNIYIRTDSSTTEKKTTVSMGLISIIPDNTTTVEEMIKASDKALYVAKKKKFNSISVGEIEEDNEK